MAAAVGSEANPDYAPGRAGELDRNVLDVERAGIQLGWRPWTELGDGVRAVIDSVRTKPA